MHHYISHSKALSTLSQKSETVSLFCDSVDRALGGTFPNITVFTQRTRDRRFLIGDSAGMTPTITLPVCLC